ncbi:hypothetical protein BGX23_009737 [Mortierella sp. AD031]|nr:hypothetical protein BGX23_009737 [Mortierella sp. AD031]
MVRSTSREPTFATSHAPDRDIPSVLYELAGGLDRGYPENWGQIMQNPSTSTSWSDDAIHPSDLASLVGTWGLSNDIYGRAHGDLEKTVRLAGAEGVYISQSFTYNWRDCRGEDGSLCYSTLIAVVRVTQLVGSVVWRVEIGHLYLESRSKPKHCGEKFEPVWLGMERRRVCGCFQSEMPPDGYTMEQLQDIETVFSTHQSERALLHLSSKCVQSNTNIALSTSATPQTTGSLGDVLRLFIDNTKENKDVLTTHNNGLLHAVQNATQLKRQTFNQMQLSVSESNAVPMLRTLLSDCFEKAGVQESVDEWWNRVYPTDPNRPISVECQLTGQRREVIKPPAPGCFVSANATFKTDYLWIMIAPRDSLLDVLFMESNLEVTFLECEPEEDHEPSNKTLDGYATIKDEVFGSVVRWASVQPDGSFNPVQYLARWTHYSLYVTKVLLDLLRFASAASFLKVPVLLPELIHQEVADEPTVPPQDPAYVAIMKAIQLAAETWEKVTKAIGNTMTRTVQRKVCLGFDAVNYTVGTFNLEGITPDNLPRLVEGVVRLEELPNRDDIKRLMLGVTYSRNFTWMAESMIYSAPNGEQSFLFFAKYTDPETDMTKVLYSRVRSNYVLAPDMLIVHQKRSSWLGLSKSDTVSIEYIPHTMTLNDALMLEMFFEMKSFHQIAIALALPSPKYPDLTGLCDRSIP